MMICIIVVDDSGCTKLYKIIAKIKIKERGGHLLAPFFPTHLQMDSYSRLFCPRDLDFGHRRSDRFSDKIHKVGFTGTQKIHVIWKHQRQTSYQYFKGSWKAHIILIYQRLFKGTQHINISKALKRHPWY